jgi:hypothetical protein
LQKNEKILFAAMGYVAATPLLLIVGDPQEPARCRYGGVACDAKGCHRSADAQKLLNCE